MGNGKWKMENGEKSAALSRNNKAKLQLSRASLVALWAWQSNAF